MAREILLVCHGDYDNDTHNLNEAGRQQAERARDDIVARELGSDAILLSSDALQALQTAEIIGEGLGIKPIASFPIERGGARPQLVKSLDAFLLASLRRERATPNHDNYALVVVTHAPLISEVRGLEWPSDVAYGGVYDYAPGTWVNPKFDAIATIVAFNGIVERSSVQ